MEKPLLKDLVHTYGKTWVLWQTDRGDSLPLGIPQLMMVATKDGQVTLPPQFDSYRRCQWNPKLFENRDKRYGWNTEQLRRDREEIPIPKVHPNADSWKTGDPIQFHMKEQGR